MSRCVQCMVCRAEVPESQIAAHRESVIHLENFRASLGFGVKWPACVDVHPDGSFACRWCKKQLVSGEMLEAHLRGKEHSKRLANSGIPMYKCPGHMEHVAEYVRLYGDEPYARFAHWPDTIVDAGLFWECRACVGKRKFHTQAAVNEHLVGHTKTEGNEAEVGGFVKEPPLTVKSEETPIRTENAPSSSWFERNPHWPSHIVSHEDGVHWSCELCGKKFNSNEGVDAHLVHPKHVARASGMTGVREVAITQLRQRELGRFVDRARRECFMCETQFASEREMDDHIDDLLHLRNYYAFTVDLVA